MIETLKKYKWYLLTILALIILVFMHFFKMMEVPYGLNVDEVAAAYDAYNIATYGVDRHLNSYPVYFTNYGDGQNALYIYITAVLFKIFGASSVIIRMVPAFMSLIAAYFGYRYMSCARKEKSGKVIWLCLYAILPIFVMTQRFGLESHLLLPLSMVSLFFAARALQTEEWKYYLCAGIILGITLYTYALTYIVIPLFVLLILIYGFLLNKRNVKNICIMLLPLAVLAAPLILVQAVNYFDLPQMQIGPFTITKLLEYRVDEVKGVSPWQNMKDILINTLFFDDLRYNTIPGFGTVFYISIPFIFIGIWKAVTASINSVKEKRFDHTVPMFLWFVCECIMGLLLTGSSDPNTTRMNGIFMPLLYFLVLGLYQVWDFIKSSAAKRAYAVSAGIIYAVGFVCFATYYFTDYNNDAFPMKWLFYESYEEVGDFLEENQDASWTERSISYPWNYAYYLWEYKINPYEMNIPENGLDVFGKDYINEFPGDVMLASNYVVFRTDQGTMEYLASIGYAEILSGDDFYFYVSPLDEFIQKTETDNVQAALDRFDIAGNELVLSGWCIDQLENKTFTAFTARLDDMEIPVQITARGDVAEHFRNENFVNSGFLVYLPLDALKENDSIQIAGIREDGTKEIILSFSRK